jgi:hypothetical protein
MGDNDALAAARDAIRRGGPTGDVRLLRGEREGAPTRPHGTDRPPMVCEPIHETRFPEWAEQLVAEASPLMWRKLEAAPDCRAFRHITGSLVVLITGSVEEDGKRWLHVSCSHAQWLPSWEELRMVKDQFIGKERKAIVVLPVAAEHVSHHPYCLHLWHCADADPLPNFLRGRPRGQL